MNISTFLFGWNFRFDLPEGVLIHPRPFLFKQIDVVGAQMLQQIRQLRFPIKAETTESDIIRRVDEAFPAWRLDALCRR
jgi:hypothetical protein